MRIFSSKKLIKTEYKPPEEKTYTTHEYFKAVDTLDDVALVVIGKNFELQGYNPVTHQYDKQGFRDISTMLSIDTLVNLVRAYENRKQKE